MGECTVERDEVSDIYQKKTSNFKIYEMTSIQHVSEREGGLWRYLLKKKKEN